jgi:predicted PurR-regulated permease PerM
MDELVATGDGDASDLAPTSVRGVAATILFVAGAIFVLREAAPFAAPILVSVLLAYALEPAVELFMRCGFPRAAAVVVTYALLAMAIAGGAQLAKRQAVAFVDQLPNTIAAIKAVALRPNTDPSSPATGGTIRNLQRAAADLEATVNSSAPPVRDGVRRVRIAQPFDIFGYVLSAWTGVVAAGAQLLVVATLTFVLLLSGDRVKSKLVEVAGPRFDRQILTLDVIRVIDRQIQRYLIARVAISLIVAAATAAAMWWIGVRQPLVLGTIAGVLNVLPFIGPAVGVAVCSVVAFIQFHSVQTTLAAGAAATLVAALEGNLITPWLTSRAGELNTVAVFVSVLFWGWMWDVWGLLLAVPIMIAVKAAADHIEPLQPLGELLGR